MRSLGSSIFRFLRGRSSSSLLEGGEGMFSGAGEVLAEERLEDEGEGYERGRASEWAISESSESDTSERLESEAAGEGADEGTELSGELGSCREGMVEEERAALRKAGERNGSGRGALEFLYLGVGFVCLFNCRALGRVGAGGSLGG